MKHSNKLEQYIILRPGEGVVTLCGKSLVNNGHVTLYVKIIPPIELQITTTTTNDIDDWDDDDEYTGGMDVYDEDGQGDGHRSDPDEAGIIQYMTILTFPTGNNR